MSDQKTEFLIKIAKKEELQNNLLSIIFARNPNIEISRKELFFENIKLYYKEYSIDDRDILLEISDKEQSSEISKWENRDFRISKLTISNLRAYPKSEIPFGINFQDNENEVTSHIIIGNNGVGKSTLYNALEYTFTKRIGEAELRTHQRLTDNDIYFKDYLKHYNNPYNECVFNVYTKDGDVFQLDKENIPSYIAKLLNPNNHFISEFDITTNCKLDFESSNVDSFNNLIAKNVGLSDLVDLDKDLFQFINYKRLTESNNLKKAKDSFDEANSKIKSYKEQILEKKDILKLSSEEISNKHNDHYLKLLELKNKLNSNNYYINFDYQELRKNILIFKEQRQILKQLTSKIGNISEVDFLQNGLELLKEFNNCPFCKNSNLTKNEIQLKIEKEIKEYEFYSKNTSENESTANKILDALNNIINNFYQLRNQIEIETKQTVEIFINENYNKVISELRRIFINTTSNDLVSDLELNKNKTDNKSFKSSDFLDFILERSENYLVEFLPFYINEIKNLNDQRMIILKDFETSINIQEGITDKILKESNLINEIKQLENQVIDLDNNLEKLNKDYRSALNELELFNRIKKDTSEFYKVIHKEITEELGKVFNPLKDIILNVLNDYLNETRKIDIELVLDNESDDKDIETGEILSTKIVAYIKNKNDGTRIPVNRYFNTFHYKLFCTMVAISIAIASREKTKINLPLILDDIFYSSDFGNRATIERFIHNLFKLFTKYTPTMPLQLIMFTHDNMIFDSAIHALNNSENNKISFGKLFHPKDSELLGDYKNLVSRIPSRLPFKILSKANA